MPFQLSPGVNVTEVDLTTVIPAVATSDAAIGGVFKWGPVDKPIQISSEDKLAAVFGKPSSDNYETWMTASSFLAYANSLYVSRAHHSFGNNIKTVIWSLTGADYAVILDTTSSGVSTGDVIAPIAGTIDEVAVTVDTSTITDVIQQTNVNTGTDTFDQGLINIREGEKVTVSSDGTLPAALGDGSGPFFVINVDTGSFQLSLSQSGTAIVLGDTGTGNMTITRSGQTRLTFAGTTWAGSDGNTLVEFYDSAYSFNAVAASGLITAPASSHIVKNEDSYTESVANFDANARFVAKYPGAMGNSLKVSVCDSPSAFKSAVTMASGATTSLAITVGANTGTISSDGGDGNVTSVVNQLSVGDYVEVGNTVVGVQHLEITEIGTVSGGASILKFATPLSISENVLVASSTTQTATFNRRWKHWDLISGAPGQSAYVSRSGNTAANDELAIVVTDEDGMFTGVPGTVLEVFDGMSRATDAKDEEGGTIYYKEVVNSRSRYIWWANDDTSAVSASAALVASSGNTKAKNMSFSGGRDIGSESDCDLGDVLRAYDKFKSAEDLDISLVLVGKSRGAAGGAQLANYIVDNVTESRKDCVAFVSPSRDVVVDNVGDIAADVVDFRNNCRSTSYAVMDSGYKYMYDKYNDVYRWVPMNGDIAGLAAHTDQVRDAWWSPAGFNRGNIKNIVKLAWNPDKTARDTLYKNGVNPIVNFPGQGIVMFGDKTMLAKPSAFDRINVRRLFIVLEKAIATASKFTLFEFNDEFTRASFVNLVTPFLRDVKGRRGITDFAVVCDETNNTGEVVDRNEFVGDIYIKPARSINFIQLNFVAVRSGVEFSEVIGNV